MMELQVRICALSFPRFNISCENQWKVNWPKTPLDFEPSLKAEGVLSQGASNISDREYR
jgi:hypothetical protein